MNNRRSAIITGICGQDGSYLADILLEKDYKIYGFKRRTSSNDLGCASHLKNEKNLEIIEGDLNDLPSLIHLCKLARADEFYNLAAMSHVGTSFNQPVYTTITTGLGVLNCLEAIRESRFYTKFYQASTSEMLGGIHGEVLCNELTPFHPRSPYGVAKLFGHWMTINYRESYKMFACTGILYNHESIRRGPNFVTRKITLGIANILAGKQDHIYLGNLDAKRDWGYAKDYCVGMWMMLQHHTPDDYILATGKTHSVREFCDIAFAHVDLDYQNYIKVDPELYRPAEVDILIGDASKASNILGWHPTKSFNDLVIEMVDSDINKIFKGCT